MKKLLTLLLLLCTASTQAQNYKWVKGGGGISTITSSYDDEASYHLTTDKQGNVYSLNIVGSDMVAADTFSYQSFGAQNNVLVTSYNCEGQMRWAKFIRATPTSTRGLGIESDTLGNIYVAIRKNTGILYIDNDTVINMTQLYTAVIQFDTNGSYNWVRFVGSDVPANTVTNSTVGALAIDGQQNVHFFTYIGSGAQLSTSIISERGVYDHTYNSNGSLIDIVRLDMDSIFTVVNAVFNPADNKLFVTGYKDPYLQTTAYAHYIAAFDNINNQLWLDTMVVAYGAITGISFDKNTQHLYVSGVGLDVFTFRGYTVTNTISNSYLSYIMKIDTAGDPIWITDYDCSIGTNRLFGIATMSDNKVAAVGLSGGLIVSSSNDSMLVYTGEGQQAFFTIVDTGGNVLKLEQLHGVGFYDRANAVAADNNGNLYIGGKLEQNIWGGTLTPYVTNGGNSDFFVMKYGYNCDCVAPDAGYTFNVNTLTGNFTFNGTTTLIDSLVWNFGDGNSETTTGTTTTHTYPNDDSTYTVCVTIYNECGNTTFCDTVHISAVSVSNLAAFPNVQVYPNPSEEYMIVEGADGMSAALYSVTGQQVYKSLVQSNKHAINTSNLSAGTYLLQLTASDGRKMNMTVVKR